MGRKKFVNQSKYDIAVQLRVRKGDIPGTIKEVKDFTLCHDTEIYMDYGDASNPYVDQISINGMCSGSVTEETLIVLEKSSVLDDMFNCNDTIIISYIDGTFKLDFKNTRTVADGLLPWDDWFYKLSYRRDEVNTLHKQVLDLQDIVQVQIQDFNKKLESYQSLVAANSALLIIKDILQMDELKYKDYRVDVEAIEIPVDGNTVLNVCSAISEIIGATLIAKAAFDIVRIGTTYFSGASTAVVEIGESCLEAGIEVGAETGLIETAEVGLEVSVEATEEVIASASCSSLATTGIGILVAVGLDMIFGAINGASEQKELDKQIRKLKEAVKKTEYFANTVSGKATELDAYVIKEEKRFKEMMADLKKVTGQEPTFKFDYPETTAEIENYKVAQSKALTQYGVFQTMKESWVTAVDRNPNITKDVFLAMLINFVPKEIDMNILEKYWDILKAHSDTMKGAEA